MAREDLLARTLVQLADTLVDDFDLADLLTLLVDRSVELLEVSSAGLMLVAPEGDLRLVASSSEAMHVVELYELQTQEGPCLDCYRNGGVFVREVLAPAVEHWPHFTPVAVAAGFRSVSAVPLQLRDVVLGALNLFSTEAVRASDSDLTAAKALADMATIAILQYRAALEARRLNEHLNHALNDRLIIEQAKGVLSERTGIEMERSFATLRNHARNHNLRLADVAQRVIDGTLRAEDLDPPRPTVRTTGQE